MAIRVDSLDRTADHAGSAKPKHSPPASNQHSLKIAEDLLQWSRDGLSKATAATGKWSASTQVRSVRAQIRRGSCSDERPSLKGFAPVEATQLDWSEAQVNDQAQREVGSRNIESLEND